MHYALSAVRAAYDQRAIVNTQPLQNWLNRMAEGLYNHQTPGRLSDELGRLERARPDGGAVSRSPARSAAVRPACSAPTARGHGQGAADQPAFPLLQNALYFEDIDPALSAPTRSALGQAVSPQDWNALFLSSPEFMRR